MIHAIWTLYGRKYDRWFDTWDKYYEATFNPDCKIELLVHFYREK